MHREQPTQSAVLVREYAYIYSFLVLLPTY